MVLFQFEFRARSQVSSRRLPAGLVPSVHDLFVPGQDVDARDKPAHDDENESTNGAFTTPFRSTGQGRDKHGHDELQR